MPSRFLIAIVVGICLFSFAFSKVVSSGPRDAHGTPVLITTYQQGMRAPIFTGFLTLGSFLLTLQATLLLRIKEIYDTANYTADWQVLREQSKNLGVKTRSYYRPLENLGAALLTNVFLALVSSLLQMSLGLVSAAWAVGISLAFAATTMLTLLWLWWHIAANLIRWFDVIETNRVAKIDK